MESKRPVKIHTLKTALEKLRKYCAYQERTQQEVRDKFYELGLHQKEVEQGISLLIEEGFINEERFAIAFAGGRFRIKQWGKNKIKSELRIRKLSEYCIRKALSLLDDKDYIKTLEKLIVQKSNSTKGVNEAQKKYKVARYAIGRGFESELVWDILNANAE